MKTLQELYYDGTTNVIIKSMQNIQRGDDNIAL